MSNARSPRDVCSTTIGTRGLISIGSRSASVTFLFRCSTLAVRQCIEARSSASGRPELAGLASLFGALALGGLALLGRPDRLTGLGLLHGDRLRGLGDQLGGLAHADLLAQQPVASVLLEPGDDLLG